MVPQMVLVVKQACSFIFTNIQGMFDAQTESNLHKHHTKSRRKTPRSWAIVRDLVMHDDR